MRLRGAEAQRHGGHDEGHDEAVGTMGKDDRGRIALIGGSPDRIVADSFTEFVDRQK